uniref:Endothelial differentiation-related factor 1 n=1 Tax=Rattus norvegicus TaxID=10116 RepID=A0ABK0L496_RAT
MWRHPKNVGTQVSTCKARVCCGIACLMVWCGGTPGNCQEQRLGSQEIFLTCRHSSGWHEISGIVPSHLLPATVGRFRFRPRKMLGLACQSGVHLKSFPCADCKPHSVPLTLPAGAAGQNKQHSITKNTAKLDRETEELHHDRVTLEVGKVIQRGRQSKGLTQKDLATKINEKPQVIADYESGRAIPNNQVLGKIERAIGLKLRGKDIGKPIEKGPKAK